MRKLQKTEITSLSDVFSGWIGGIPENDNEVRNFLKQNRLDGFLDKEDVYNILNHSAYFPEHLLPTIYAVLPIRLPTAGKPVGLLPQELARLNHRVIQNGIRPRSLDLSLRIAADLLKEFSAAKKEEVKKEQKRRISQRYRAAHPERIKESSKASWQKEKQQTTLEERSNKRRQTDARYRKNHAAELSKRFKLRRQTAKLENPLAVYEADAQNNRNPNKKEINHRYYQKNKQKITAKAKENPKTKTYKQRYKSKIRFQKQTGKTILSLLQGIIISKQSR